MGYRYITEGLSIYDRLKFMVEHPAIVNAQGVITRAQHWRDTLLAAWDVLPEGKEKRAIEYLNRHPDAKLWFVGKTDVVKPALEHAIRLIETKKENWHYKKA